MPTPITETTVSFTYKIADELYSQTDTQNLTASATYTGPDRIWVFVNDQTGALVRELPDLTTQEDGADVPTPPGTKKIEIRANDDPLIISLIRTNLCTHADTSKITESLPDGSTISYNAKATVDQTYDLDQLTYNLSTNNWNIPPYRASTVSWDDIINARNGLLTSSDGKIAPDMPSNLKTAWTTYRQALRDLPSTFGKGTPNEVEAWKVAFPTPPVE